jgi:hypothetical protein
MKGDLYMETWEVKEDHLIALIYEINRLGQSLLEFGEEAYGPYYSSRLAEITLRMLGLEGTPVEISAGDPAGNAGSTSDDPEGFDAGPYSYLFNSEVFLNENLLGEILAGIRQNPDGFYIKKTRTTETGSAVVWEIEEKLIIDLIKELYRLGRVMARLEDKPYGVYFSTGLPDIILRMLGIPESYSGIPYEDFHKLVKKDDDGSEKGSAKHPAAYDGSFDYDMFRYSMSDETIKKFLDYKREHRDEYRRIRAEQAKLGDRLHEPDAYDALYDEIIKGIETGKIRPDQPESDSEDC